MDPGSSQIQGVFVFTLARLLELGSLTFEVGNGHFHAFSVLTRLKFWFPTQQFYSYIKGFLLRLKSQTENKLLYRSFLRPQAFLQYTHQHLQLSLNKETPSFGCLVSCSIVKTEAMNSMFSSFDALCAELLGQSVRASLSSFAKGSSHAAASVDASKKQQGDSQPPPACIKKERQQQRAPRFAPELDGLNCFETLVSY